MRATPTELTGAEWLRSPGFSALHTIGCGEVVQAAATAAAAAAGGRGGGAVCGAGRRVEGVFGIGGGNGDVHRRCV